MHGGTAFSAPVLVDDRVLARLRPGLPQVACFDTAFHHDLPPVARRFALPRAFDEQGVRRYGFHGPLLRVRRSSARGGRPGDRVLSLTGLLIGCREGGAGVARSAARRARTRPSRAPRRRAASPCVPP
ncbi:MAG: hypothetical protein ACREV7_19050 [Steroidobacteraceae bacterium]